MVNIRWLQYDDDEHKQTKNGVQFLKVKACYNDYGSIASEKALANILILASWSILICLYEVTAPI